MFKSSLKILLAIVLFLSILGYALDRKDQQQDSTKVDTVQQPAKQQQSEMQHNDEIHISHSNALHGIEVKLDGRVSFNDDYRSITGISQNGYLMIRERRWFTSRILEVTPGKNGPEFQFRFRGRSMPYDERAQEWISEILPDVIRETGINADQRVQELLELGGAKAVYREISRMETSSAKYLYFKRLLQYGSLNNDELLDLAKRIPDEIRSSSKLRNMLSAAASFYLENDELTAELFRGATRISSSGEKRLAITTIAETRTVQSESALEMAKAIQTISSSGEKRAALVTMPKYCPMDEDVIFEYLYTAESISSSGERAEALIALIETKSLPHKSWVDLARTTKTISSSGEKTRTLNRFATQCPTDDDVIREYLETAKSISSSGSKASAILALSQRKKLSPGAYKMVFHTTKTISSSSEKANVLRRYAAITPLQDDVLFGFLDAAFSISSSGNKLSVIRELLQRDGISTAVLKEIKSRTNQMSGRSSREALLDMVSEKMLEETTL